MGVGPIVPVNNYKTYDADNQLTGPGTYVYDGNGYPTTWSGTSLAFDVENRMTAYGTTLTAGYRGDGLRAWKNTASGQTYFLYDGISVVCELDAGGNVIAGSTHGAAGLLSRGSVPAVWRQPSASSRWGWPWPRATVRAVTSPLTAGDRYRLRPGAARGRPAADGP